MISESKIPHLQCITTECAEGVEAKGNGLDTCYSIAYPACDYQQFTISEVAED